MSLESNQSAANELLRAIQYMIDEATKKQTQIYNGLIVGANGDDWSVQVNGKVYTMSQYGEISTPSVGKIVKVVLPNGNASLAFFI